MKTQFAKKKVVDSVEKINNESFVSPSHSNSVKNNSTTMSQSGRVSTTIPANLLESSKTKTSAVTSRYNSINAKNPGNNVRLFYKSEIVTSESNQEKEETQKNGKVQKITSGA